MGQCISSNNLRPSPFYFLFKLHCQLANPNFSASFEPSLTRVDRILPFQLSIDDRRLLLMPVVNKFDVNRDGVLSSTELLALVRSFVQSLATDYQAFVVEKLKQSVDKKSLARFESEIAPKLNKSFQHFSAEFSTPESIEKFSVNLLAHLDSNSDSHISVFEFLAGFLSEAFALTHSFVSSVLKHAFDSKYHELVAAKASEVTGSVPEITSNEMFQSNPSSTITEKPIVKAEVKATRSNSIEQPRVQNAAMVAASPLLASFAAAAPKKIELTRPTSMSVSGPRPSITAPSVAKHEIKAEPPQEAKPESKPEEKPAETIVNTESVVVVVPTNVATSSVETPLPASSDSDVLLEALNMLKLAVMSSDASELELAVRTGKVAVSNGFFDADLLYLIQHAESILYPIEFRKRSASESSSDDDDDSVSNQSIATEFESDAVAAWAFRIEKQLRDAIQSGLSAQIDEALVLATEYRSAGNPATAPMTALVARAIEIRSQDEDSDEDSDEEADQNTKTLQNEAAPSQAAAAPEVQHKPVIDANLIQVLAALDVKITAAKKRMTDALRIAHNAQITGDVNVADEQRRFASYASSDVRRFEEQRAALLR